MKKILPIAAALVFALAGCSSASQPAEETAPEAEVVQEETAEESTVDEGVSIDWTEAKTAEEAAKGAGFEKFGVLPKITLGDITFENPTFAYAGGVAQATYETGATGLYFRKAQDTYSTPLSDRALDEFPARWNKIYEGVDVACYGPAKGAVTVATWTDGNTSYGLTYQGLGGEEMSMDIDELYTIVKGVHEANADQTPDEKKSEEKKTDTQSTQQQNTNKSGLLTDVEAEAVVEKACQGTCISIDRVTTKAYGECWYAVCVDNNGNRFEYYVNNDGAYLIDEKGAQKENTNSNANTNKKTGAHYEGEPVTIYDSIYANWHQMNNGEWYAVFTTYNGTQILAQTAPAGGGWVFYAMSNGQTVQVIYSDQESSVTGEYGPAGVSSHWTGLDNGGWY